MKLDVVTLEVVRNMLPAIANEMSHNLQRTSYNMMIYEVRDYCCALLDPEGRLISQNVGGVSHFVSDLGVVIRDAVARYGPDGFAPGDGFTPPVAPPADRPGWPTGPADNRPAAPRPTTSALRWRC